MASHNGVVVAFCGFYMVIAVIPAYNEERTIGNVLAEVWEYVDKIIVVDDGSADKTAEIVKRITKSDFDKSESDFNNKNVEVLSHILNRGLGAALRTGFAGALKIDVKTSDVLGTSDVNTKLSNPKVATTDLINNGVAADFRLRSREDAEIIITLDADGQHNPEDIPRMIEPIKNGSADVVIGSRFISKPFDSANASLREYCLSLSKAHAPLFRKLANFLGNIITFLFFGIWVSDSQSGFRAFSREALLKINLKSSGMEVSSEIIKEIKRNHLCLVEIPIKPVYTKYSMSKGQNLLEGIKTVFQLILRRLE